jgi:hypothetical protein
MTRLIALILAGMFLLSCSRDEGHFADRFVRNFALEGNSSMSDIIELPNGNLLLCGQLAKPAFNSNVSSEFSSSDLEESAPALVLTNAEGLVIDYFLYPIGNIDIDPIINLSDLTGKARFLEIESLENGGYLVHGEFRNFGISVGFNSPDPEPESRNTIPFLVRINANFELESFQQFNGQAPWDGHFRSSGRLKAKPDGSGFIFMIGFDYHVPTDRFLGFELHELDADGNFVRSADFDDQSVDKFARDFCFLENGKIGVAGSRLGSYYLFEVDEASLSQSKRTFLGDDGTGERFNNNLILVEPLSDGGVFCFYTDPVEINYIHHLDAQGNTLRKVDLAPHQIDQYPINSSVCQNGDVLLTCSDLEDPSLERAVVYRLNPEGISRWSKTFDGRVLSIKEAEDGDLFVLVDLIYGAGSRKATLFKLDPHGALY